MITYLSVQSGTTLSNVDFIIMILHTVSVGGVVVFWANSMSNNKSNSPWGNITNPVIIHTQLHFKKGAKIQEEGQLQCNLLALQSTVPKQMSDKITDLQAMWSWVLNLACSRAKEEWLNEWRFK